MTGRSRSAWAWVVIAASAVAASDDARPLLDAFKRREQTDRRWNDRRQSVTFDVHNAGDSRRSLMLYEKHAADGSRKLLARILEPPSQRGFGLLVQVAANGRSQQWIHGAGMNGSREVSAGQSPLAQSDLTYDDLELVTVLPGWGADDAESSSRGTDLVDGETCDVIELVPKRKSTHYKSIKIWLGKTSLLVRRLELSRDDIASTKRITQTGFDDGRIPVAHDIKVETLGDTPTSTDITVTVTDFDTGIGDECFNKSTLEDPGRDADACRGHQQVTAAK